VLCVGDVMLDDFVYGEVSRISPEAPTPVLAVRHNVAEIGGAGTVARNIAALGARCIFVGLVGDDAAGLMLTNALAKFDGAIVPDLVVDRTRQTTRKVRFVSEHHSAHLLRADWEDVEPASAESQAAVIAYAEAALPQVGAVVLSDYVKGVLTERVIRAIIDAARRRGTPVIVDPKFHDYRVYRGATLLTPNRKELAAAVHRPVTSQDEVAAAAAELARLVGSEAVLVKRSEEGMTLHVEGHAPVHVPAYAVKVRDVSGAGDTVAAVMAVLLALRAPFEAAMRAANAAAAVVVGKRGTSTVSFAELRHRILPAASLAPEDKIAFDWAVLDERLAEWRRRGLRIGFTNGCCDASTRRLKGNARPINPVEARAEVLAALEAVDLVVVFEEDTPLELIRRVQPAVLVKGGDYKPEEVVGREVVEAAGGSLILVDPVPGHSTTAIVKRAQPVKEPAGE
jgi:D-beta-D-heptose 7-phosphate kinase / D-beta-D-heptose 1-phosphate adenosyltransferase